MPAARLDVLEKIKELEKKEEFDQHLNPIDYDIVLPIDNFNYIKRGFEKLKIFFQNTFIVKPYTFYLNHKVTKTKVFGRKNLKGIKSAIVTCNHVFMFDCLVAKHGLRGHKLRITAADFNNRKGFLGEMMRAGGLMPFSPKYENMKRFNHAMDYFLKKNHYVMFYPEQAMWYMYDKPRPYKNGAFHYAVKHDVPIIPMFITYRNSGKFDENGMEDKYFTLHIMEPIFSDTKLNNKENVNYMREKNYEMSCKKYFEVYGKKPEYQTKDYEGEI